ncbi:MAG: cobalamin B12-binding domain-containing protein [Candidatus Helarchaeota archaeon]|nr:cobalamin B12-binding domain-containing protein [Candidatus Helarchaeota archaeon]
MSSKLIEAIINLEEEESIKITQDRINSGEDPLNLLNEVRGAMTKIGKRFENKEYFLPDLMMSGEILRQISDIITPKLKKIKTKDQIGKILLGTVAGDIHDIGKDIVKFMLEANGFEVLDLGVDVPADKFVEKVKEFKPDIVALSGFLTIAFDAMKETVQKIKDAGFRDKVKIMVGGGTVDEQVKIYAEADAFGDSAVDAVNFAKKWMGVS